MCYCWSVAADYGRCVLTAKARLSFQVTTVSVHVAAMDMHFLGAQCTTAAAWKMQFQRAQQWSTFHATGASQAMVVV